MTNGKKLDILRHTEWQRGVKYIAGPITHGDVQENIHRAIMVGEFYYRQGYSCYIPHLDWDWVEQYPKPYEDLLRMSGGILKLLRRGDELVRLPGYSPGSDREIEAATKFDAGPSIKIMRVADCEAVEEALGESFPYLPEGQTNLKGLTHPGQ